MNSGDGCNSVWAVEQKYNCFGGDSSNEDTWELWGDAKRESTSAKNWDDGNNVDGDGWSSSWFRENGWTWSGGSLESQDTWTEIWGDGIRFNSNSSYWDDGNILNGDGCNYSWSVEPNWEWSRGKHETNFELYIIY